MMMRISKPDIQICGERAVWICNVHSRRFGENLLWFSVPVRWADWLSLWTDPAVIALLPVAMERSEDLCVEGNVSARLAFGLRGAVQDLLRIQNPFLSQVELNADGEREDESPGACGVATGFSAGVDSFAVLHEHLRDRVSPGFKVTVLLFNNVGSHGVGGAELFRRRWARVEAVAQELGLPLIDVDSNLDTFFPATLPFQRTHSLRNAAVAHLLRGGIRRLFYASGYTFADSRVAESVDAAALDPILLPLVSTQGTDLILSGASNTRVEKTLSIAEWPIVQERLDVCVNPYYTGDRINCSACWKCLRTLATLEIAGLVESFGKVFDLQVYRKSRGEFFNALQGATDPLQRELREFAEGRGFRFEG